MKTKTVRIHRAAAFADPTKCAACFGLALLLIAAISVSHAQTLPDLSTYNFTAVETNTLPGTSTSPAAPCNGTITPTNQIGSLALVALFFQNACYTDGRFNHNNYRVERGTVSPSGGGAGLAAYRIYEPLNKATQFLASRHAIYYRFPTIENYSVYSFANGTMAKVADVPAAAIPNTTDFIQVTNGAGPITVSEVTGSIIYVFAPSATRVSSFTLLAPGVEGARLAITPFGDVLKYRYTVAGAPFDSALDYSTGPGSGINTYSDTRRFFLVRNGNALGVVWQNQADASLKLTWFGANRTSPSTVALANPQTQALACATGDDAGNVYFLTVQTGDGAPNTARNATLTKAGPTGATIATTALDTSNAGNGLNMVSFGRFVASLKHLNGKLGLMIGRKMLQSGDGLNHQGGIAVVFDATTLALERNWGQTSGHSWENVLTSNTNGQFVGIDMGDNFPRGIHLHKFTATNENSRVISSYKTLHGTTAQSPDGTTYPVYTEISGGGTTYYRWSNDNQTYTELGGLAQTSLGYAVSFAGERSAGGRLLDSSRVGAALNDPRNIGFITVREDFQNATGGGVQVSDDLVVTTGLVETGGYYGFTGGLTPQRNAGVVWLTQYNSLAQNVSRLKMTPRADGTLLLLWEVWTANSYVATKGMTVAPNGTIVNGETDLPSQVRLGRRDDPLRVDNSIYQVAGKKADTAIELIVIEPGGAGTAPNITAHPQPQTTGVGGNANFTVAATGTPTLAYQWRFNAQNLADGPGITGSQTAALALQNVQLAQAGNYDVVITNSLGRQSSNPALLTVNAGGTAPGITAHPQPQTVTVGANANFTVTATGTAPLAYQWRRNAINLTDGVGIAGSQTAALALQNIQLAQAGNYDVVVTNSLGRQTSNPALLTINAPANLGSALNTVDLPWTTAGNANWFVQTTNTHDNVNAAQSGQITHSQESRMETMINGPATIAFWWRVESEQNYDYLRVELDGAMQFRITGTINWEQKTVAVPAGTHTLRWVYSKDGSASAGADAGWVDQVEVRTFQPPPSLADALDTTNITWAATGDRPWFAQTATTHDNVDAVQSGPITDNQATRLEATILGPANLSFWWKVDSEGAYDYLTFELDGAQPATAPRISGNVNWEQKTVPIPAGTHTIRWTYSKDTSANNGADAGWVDQVVLTRLTPGEAGEPPPLLEYTASGHKLRITWPEVAANFKLQAATSLLAGDWTDVPENDISKEEGEFFIIVNTSVGSKFYRLVEAP